MSVENGKCPSCGGALLLDSSKEKVICKYCGHEIIIQQAIQKCTVDGIADFDTKMLSAGNAIEFDQDFDKAAKYYKEALDLRPNDYRALWGMFLCEIAAIRWAYDFKGYVQVPGDIYVNLQNAINRYGNRAYANAPEKKGCYIATAVYGSYDCPEVWVLRRYRDNNLSNHRIGRSFIKIYYALSPMIVKLLGHKQWFNTFWRKKLDKMVGKLKERGYSDTPYND